MKKFLSKSDKFVATLLLALLLLTSISVKNIIENTNTRDTNAKIVSAGALSNTKIGWGIKREKDHKQPDLGKVNNELINKYEGISIGNSESKIIYLTFDQGYEAGYTEKILDVLKENNVSATFFITAHYLNTREDLVKRMIDEGHIVGNHTVNHKSMPDISDEEIKEEVLRLHQSIYEKFGYEMKYIRPPKGEYSERTLSITNSLGYKTVMWSFAYKDWDEKNQNGEEKAKKIIIDNLHNGEVMLLHATSKDNMNVLDYVIKKAREMGYEFKSLDEFDK